MVFRVAVLGGGITGLAAAHRLGEIDPLMEATVFEASPRLGGVLQTSHRDGFLIEHGADMFSVKEPWAAGLCRRIGFHDELIGVNSKHRRAFIVHKGRLYPVPEGFSLMTPTRAWPVMASPLLSVRGKLRLAGEWLAPARRDAEDESLAEFATRRVGREAYERLVQPLVAGIYTADPHRLSMKAALSRFYEMERKHGGLLRAMLHRNGAGDSEKKASGARYDVFAAPRRGMGQWIDALAARLGTERVHCGRAVRQVVHVANNQWDVRFANDGVERFDAVILATPAPRTAELLADTDAELAHELASIEHASSAVLVMAYRRADLAHRLDGFGCVAPLAEGRNALSISFSSVKFADRAPHDAVLLRVFFGGACQPELAEASDEALAAMARHETAELLGARGEPLFTQVVRWRNQMPQYHVGHLDRVARIEERSGQHAGLAIAGNAFRGVGIPFCVRSGEAAAERVAASLLTCR